MALDRRRISRQFSLRILHTVECQISESLDKYLRLFQADDDSCPDWLNLAVFDSKGPTFWLPFCLFTKICNLTVPCARVHKVIFQTLRPGIGKVYSPSFHVWFRLISYIL